MMQKKGVFLTLSLTFFVLIIFSISLLLFRQADLTESIVANLIFVQKMQDLDSSIKTVFAETYLQKIGLNYYQLNNASLTIIANISRSFTDYDALVADLETDIENDFSFAEVYLNDMLDTHGIIFYPLGIAYNFNYTDGNTNGVYISNNPYIKFYNLTLFLNTGMNFCTNNLAGGGSASLNLTVISRTNNCSYIGSLSQGSVDLVDANSNNVQVGLTSSGGLNITASDPFPNKYLTINLTINFNQLNRSTAFYLPMEIEVSDDAFGFNKRSNVYLPLNN